MSIVEKLGIQVNKILFIFIFVLEAGYELCLCPAWPVSVFCVLHHVRRKCNVRCPFSIVLGANIMLGAMENVRYSMEFINILSLNTIFVILQVR